MKSGGKKNMGGVFYYIPKLERYEEATLWNKIFAASEKYLNLQKGTIKCTVLIETIGAGIEMEEILYELKDYIVALNAGRWDYIFSIIRMNQKNPLSFLPDRNQITM
eukprot:NODE_1269_length_1573_cov_8.271784_g1198_i0.p1 GENE.NODE_1269_length_1573_cov_8.271784_g1198_i0~~NODE_1269_length_1573_cov_8.271784_g1198_i0.p1  ORF type:complete len:107 (-),score=2.53 NODE_1269_length_1573_cov_8.271784_g1198_i0:645-965(-)